MSHFFEKAFHFRDIMIFVNSKIFEQQFSHSAPPVIFIEP